MQRAHERLNKHETVRDTAALAAEIKASATLTCGGGSALAPAMGQN